MSILRLDVVWNGRNLTQFKAGATGGHLRLGVTMADPTADFFEWSR